MRIRSPLVVLAVATLLGSSDASADAPEVLTLGNGLVVVIHRIKEAEGVAVALDVPYGRAHDPEGQEGGAEVALRALALGKAGAMPERRALTLQGVDRAGAKCVVEVGRLRSSYVARGAVDGLPAQLDDIAARFAGVEPSDGLLGEIRETLRSLRDGATSTSSSAAAVFRARIDAMPEPHGNRPYGTPEGVDATGIEQVKSARRSALATRGVVIAIVGALDPARVRALAKKTLGAIVASETVERTLPPGPAPGPAPGPEAVAPVHVTVHGPAARKRHAALALAGPAPADAAALAPYLVLAARLAERLAPAAAEVLYDPATEPGLITLRRLAPDSEDDAAAIASLRSALEAARNGAVGARDVLAVRKWFQPRLGLRPTEGPAGFDLLGQAHALARLRALGWAGDAAIEAVKKVRAEQVADLLDKSVVRTAVAGP